MWKVVVLLTVAAPLFAAIHPNYQPDLVSKAKAMDLAHDSTWLKLLHYKKGLFGGYESEADGQEFFLAKDGKTNPEAELAANLEAFYAPVPKERNDHAMCKFPARYRWLKEKLGFDAGLKICPRLLEFRESVSAKSASIIFSSYYLNNPASAFGHSFLRLNKTEASFDGKRYELLDNGINYAAVVTQENPILYAFYGVFGLFKGTFTRIPYYYKVREYNDFESRDLWVYDLNLTDAQVSRLVDHIWELGSTYFDYYYLSENCSYHILTALEAAIDGIDLTSGLPYVVVPADTIKAITKSPNLVSKVRYAPSVRSQFLARIDPMPVELVGDVKEVVQSKRLASLPENLSPEEKASVLDAAIDHVDFKAFRRLVEEPEGPEAQWKQKLLVSRARIPVRSPDLIVATPEDEVPHIGHEIMRGGAEAGAGDKLGGYGAVQLRFALHDLIDPKPGYPEFSQIEFFNTRLRYLWERKEFWVEDFSLFRVISLSPLTTFDKQLSWKVKVGGTTIRDQSCDHCFAGQIEVGGGFAKTFFGAVTAFASLDGEAFAAPGFSPRSFLRPGAGPSLLLRARLTRDLLAVGTASYRYRLFTDEPHYSSFGGELRWALGNNVALNFKTALYPDTWENSAGLFLYF